MNRKKVRDHEGNVYNSVKEMCEAFDVPERTFRLRLKNGWSLEKALTIPPNYYRKNKIQGY